MKTHRFYALLILVVSTALLVSGCNPLTFFDQNTSPASNQDPTAEFSADPESGPAPLEVEFNASGSSDSDGTIESYEWLFGDGEDDTGEEVTHTYEEVQDYDVTLTVEDDEGATDQSFKTISVTSEDEDSVPADLYVDEDEGDDEDGDGSKDNPYKTITKAAGRAEGDQEHQTIHIAPGDYTGDLGEDDPIYLWDVSLIGEGDKRTDVTIKVELEAKKQTTLKDVKLTDVLTIDEGTVDNVLFTNPNDVSYPVVAGDNSVTVKNCKFEYGGVEASGRSIVIKKNTFEDIGSSSAVEISGSSSDDATVQDNTIKGGQSDGAGVHVSGAALAIIKDNTIKLAGVGLHAVDESQALFQGNTVGESGNRMEKGIVVEEGATVDAGGGSVNVGSTGDNQFWIKSQGYAIKDLRRNDMGDLYAEDNTVNNDEPTETHTNETDDDDPIDNPPYCFIEGVYNTVIFSE